MAGLRFSAAEALEKGFIEEDLAKEIAAQSRKIKASRNIASNEDGSAPQRHLWNSCTAHFPGWEKDGLLCWEFANSVPGRKFRLDIAFPSHRLACEVDGWEYHGKYLSDFKRDRERDRLLVLNGWRVLRFFVKEIYQETPSILEQIESALAVCSAKID